MTPINCLLYLILNYQLVNSFGIIKNQSKMEINDLSLNLRENEPEGNENSTEKNDGREKQNEEDRIQNKVPKELNKVNPQKYVEVDSSLELNQPKQSLEESKNIGCEDPTRKNSFGSVSRDDFDQLENKESDSLDIWGETFSLNEENDITPIDRMFANIEHSMKTFIRPKKKAKLSLENECSLDNESTLGRYYKKYLILEDTI